ncbi:MAG: SAM-dependent chlorinase/fluorinase [Planctomycetes bacterium]|nr:SAM-dependent chlorinase/fluorinase [Planctomycetota bacterium]
MPSQITGKVVAISPDGSLVTDISVDRLRGVPRDERVTVTCDEHETRGIYEPDHSEVPSTYLALSGTSGSLELTIVGENAARMLAIRVGESVVVAW